MSILYLREDEVTSLLQMPRVVDLVEEAFQKLACGQGDNVPRRRAAGSGIVLHSMSAAAEWCQLVGWKQYTTTRRGARFHVGLYDQSSGELVALIEADRLGQVRTGAVTGVALRWLTDPQVDTVTLIGAGWQAESQLAAAAAVRPLRQARVYCRDEHRRRAFARRMSESLSLEVVPVESAELAVRHSPVVITATTSRTPVFDGDWLDQDTFVAAIGSNWLNKTEIDLKTVQRSNAVICDSIASCQEEAGDFVAAIEQGSFHWRDAIELGDVVSGQTTIDRNGCRLFKSVGMAIEDVAVGAYVLREAREQGLGRSLP